MNITRGIPPPKGLFVTLAAVEGFGKSTLGKRMDSPVFIDADRGVTDDNVSVINTDMSFTDILGIVNELKTNPPAGIRTLVIDTIDKLVDAMANDYCRKNNLKSLEDNRYIGWMNFRKDVFAPMLDGLKYVTRKHPISILVLSHTEIKKFEGPDGGAWDRFEASFLYKKLAGDLRGASDLYSFGTFRDAVMAADKKTGETKNHATIAKGKRMVYSEHTGIWDAKVRDFVCRADGTPFPSSCTIDEYTKCLQEAIARLQTKDAQAPVPHAQEPESKPVAVAEHVQEQVVPVTDNEDFDRLNALMKQFGIPRELVDAYVKTTKTFGPNPPPLERCNAAALKWLCTGIAMQKVTADFIKNKLANAK